MFTPSAVSPPSANSTPCMSSTTETHSTPVYGPTSIAASAPPSRCPLVPAATGKFSICTAKMKAATSPASGAVRSAPATPPAPAPASSRRAPRRLTATAAAATAPVATDTGALMNPSGTCISGFSASGSATHQWWCLLQISCKSAHDAKRIRRPQRRVPPAHLHPGERMCEGEECGAPGRAVHSGSGTLAHTRPGDGPVPTGGRRRALWCAVTSASVHAWWRPVRRAPLRARRSRPVRQRYRCRPRSR